MVSEIIGTFFLVTVAAGAPWLQRSTPAQSPRLQPSSPRCHGDGDDHVHGQGLRCAFQPAVSCAFAARGDFRGAAFPATWFAVDRRHTAALMLQYLVGVSASHGANYPGTATSNLQAMLVEALLTSGLLSVILGTSSGAQNLGIMAAIGVGSYIALAGLWAAPLSGASIESRPQFRTDLASLDLHRLLVYLAGPFLGAFLAVLPGVTCCAVAAVAFAARWRHRGAVHRSPHPPKT